MANRINAVATGLAGLTLLALPVYFFYSGALDEVEVKKELPAKAPAVTRRSAPPETRDGGKAPAEGTGATASPGDAASSDTMSEMELAVRKDLAAEKQRQLDALIREYDKHLSDPEKRKRLQARINEVMDEYNRLMLPVALSELQAPAAQATP